ncbi:NAD/NADP octopine/nopaline dehydrogenase family protein [bacterium]|nr:NAD/NADP octopine/nopaline dehydrogenase family protein [bacterium]QQR57079.1 MAG: NAD/NADP octopine/nopaline dehydrogenase family protein [Candidatus Melainabacteria bacterium]
MSIYLNPAFSTPTLKLVTSGSITTFEPVLEKSFSPANHPVAIVGSGNSGLALSSYLAQQGYPVHLLARSLDKVSSLAENMSVKSVGKVEGEFELASVTTSPAESVAKSRTIFIATVTTVYADIARMLAPHLKDGQEIVLFSSKFAGSVEFSNVLAQCGVDCKRRNITVIETDALFACRIQEDGCVWIRGFKDWTLFSAPTLSQTISGRKIIQRFFPRLEQADNIIQRGLTDFGAVAHTITMLANMNKVDRAEPFLFYHEGFTERTIKLMEKLESEFRSVAEAYGTTLIPMPELLNRYYGCDTSSLYNALRTVPNYRYSQAPMELHHRYIIEDVSCSHVPIQGLARKAGLSTPVLDSVICFAQTLLDIDFEGGGRNLSKLGWADLTRDEIVVQIHS